VACVRSFLSYTTGQGWTRDGLAATVELRRTPPDHTKAIRKADLERLPSRRT